MSVDRLPGFLEWAEKHGHYQSVNAVKRYLDLLKLREEERRKAILERIGQ